MKTTATKNTDSTHTTASHNRGPDSPFFAEPQKEDPFFGNEPFFQPKLSIGAPNDPSEREADAVADQVVKKNGAEPPSHQRPANRITPLSTAGLQSKPAFESPGLMDSANQPEAEETALQQKIQPRLIQANGAEAPPPDNLASRLAQSKGQGQPMDPQTQKNMESGFGADFSGVRIHNDANAVQMNRDLGAQAFTHGNDIYFDRNRYRPGAEEGDRLLAHELTHTIQQGAAGPDHGAVQSKPAAENIVQRQAGVAPSPQPITPEQLEAVDISSNFRPNPKMAEYLDQNARKKVAVPVRIRELAQGKINVKQTNRPKEGEPAKYIIYDHQGIPFAGIDFLNRLAEFGLEPVIALVGNAEQLSGFISLKIKDSVLRDPKQVIQKINKHLEPLGLLGITPLKVPDYDNKVENGIVTFMVNDLSTTVAGYLDANGSFGLVGNTFVFELKTHVDVKGLAQGDFSIKRDENGQFSGDGEIAVAIANLNGKVKVTYVSGDVTILGSVGIQSDKFDGQVTIMVADKVTADQTMKAELGVESLEQDAKKGPEPKAPEKKTKKNQVVVGWGTVTARITEWLEGTAKVGVDSEGHITIVGEIVVPDEVELMEQKGKKITLFELEIKAGYGVPLVGQIGLFASIGLFINAGFGPLVLRDVSFSGTYSTDPSILQQFTITGTLGISAFAIIGLEAKAGVFVTLIGHDIKAGIKVTAAAGLRAYAEATPVFEYVEKASPEGGKVGEAWLKGHFEAAAQLFLKLAGSFFVELDSPWWSPAPDKTWDWPLGDVEYPIGPSMGIGGDVEWLVGSPEAPELQFSPVEFDPDKFTSDIMADPPPGKGGGKGGEQKDDGKWEDQSQKADKEGTPELKKGEGLEGKKKEDLTKLPEQQRYMRGLGEIGDLGDTAKTKPVTYSVLEAKAKKVKRKYALQTVQIKDRKDGAAKVYVKQGKYENSKNLIEIRLMSEAERLKLVQAALKDLEAKQAGKMDPAAKTIQQADAKAIAAEVAAGHYVLDSIQVIDGTDTWDYLLDLGDRQEKVKGPEKQFEENDPKVKQLQEGLKAIDQEEQKILKNGQIVREQAESVAQKVMQQHPIFISIKIVDGGNTWDYAYKVNPEDTKPGEQKYKLETGGKLLVKYKGDWQLGEIGRVDLIHGESFVFFNIQTGSDKGVNYGLSLLRVRKDLDEGAERILMPFDERAKGDGPYKNLQGLDPPDVGPFKEFTPEQKKNVIQENIKNNKGELVSDKDSSLRLVFAQKREKGVKVPANEVNIDHIWPRSKGGWNSYANAQVLSFSENLKKLDTIPE